MGAMSRPNLEIGLKGIGIRIKHWLFASFKPSILSSYHRIEPPMHRFDSRFCLFSLYMCSDRLKRLYSRQRNLCRRFSNLSDKHFIHLSQK